MINATEVISTPATPSIDPELTAAIREWSPQSGTRSRPDVTMEPRPEGLRVKLTYLGVESGVMFAWGARTARPAVQGTLDRLFDILSWRVVRPPA